MLLMARKQEGEGAQKTRLWEIKKELGLKGESFYNALNIGEALGLEAFLNYLYREPPPWLIRKAEAYRERFHGPDVLQLKSTGEGKLKVVGSVGAGGHPDWQGDDNELDVPIEFSKLDWRGFTIDQAGSSMMPYLHPGDTIVLKPQLIVRIGKFMVIRNESRPTELYVKKAEFIDDRFVFKSLNPKHEDIVADGYSLVGLVVGIISADQSIKIGPIDNGIDEEFMEFQFLSRLPERKKEN